MLTLQQRILVVIASAIVLWIGYRVYTKPPPPKPAPHTRPTMRVHQPYGMTLPADPWRANPQMHPSHAPPTHQETMHNQTVHMTDALGRAYLPEHRTEVKACGSCPSKRSISQTFAQKQIPSFERYNPYISGIAIGDKYRTPYEQYADHLNFKKLAPGSLKLQQHYMRRHREAQTRHRAQRQLEHAVAGAGGYQDLQMGLDIDRDAVAMRTSKTMLGKDIGVVDVRPYHRPDLQSQGLENSDYLRGSNAKYPRFRQRNTQVMYN